MTDMTDIDKTFHVAALRAIKGFVAAYEDWLKKRTTTPAEYDAWLKRRRSAPTA